MKRSISLSALLISAALVLGACSSDDETPASNCQELSGTSWSPDVPGVSSAYLGQGVTVSQSAVRGSGAVTGLTESPTLVSVQFSVGDLGAGGSVSLVAESEDFPSSYQGAVNPVLVSLVGGGVEFVNLSASGSNCSNGSSGLFCCSGGTCDYGSKYQIGTSASFYASNTHFWAQQINAYGNLSVNTFPTCNWSSGSPSCFLNTGSFSGQRLPQGTYTAQYALVATNYSTFGGSPPSATLKLSVVQKNDSVETEGALKLNVVLVGTKNIQDSRTEAGKRNLNSLFRHVVTHYEQAGIHVGQINAIEWSCSSGGDAYASIDPNESSNITSFLKGASSLIPEDSGGPAVNVFLVSNISSVNGGGTTLGLSAGVRGPMIQGTGASGALFSSFDKLATYNPNCTSGTTCEVSTQESSFIDMGSTISHEVGHYLGLFHPSEGSGSLHDPVPDTPTCTRTSSTGSISQISCSTNTGSGSDPESVCAAACGAYNGSSVFCPNESSCQFNHVMWWSNKLYNSTGTGDGNLFSTNSGKVLRYSPFVQ